LGNAQSTYGNRFFTGAGAGAGPGTGVGAFGSALALALIVALNGETRPKASTQAKAMLSA
jgi:hypothetical protein